MRIKFLKPAVLFLVFVVSLVVTSILTNRSNVDLTTTMDRASLPIVSFLDHGISVNELHGYTEQMDVAAMRDSVMPVGKDRTIELVITECERRIDKVAYEIRSMDGQRLVADGTVEQLKRTDKKLALSFQVQNILEEEQEYALILILQGKKDPVYYYTRLVETADYHTGECLDFALKFHDYSFREDAGDFIPTYMDPATGDSTTLQYVDLSCTLRQITWADFKGRVVGVLSPSFKEVGSSYNAVTIDYVMTSVNAAGETEYYNVQEYYRLRYTKARMYVLNFERTMNELFRGENAFVNEKTNILLGIRDEDVEYKDCGNFVAFVQEGELWSCNVEDNTVTRIFSFLETEGVGRRENWDQHDIKIVRLDEAGSVDFIVYGYMNRGDHEGQVGMSVCHYDGLSKTVEEEAFLPVNRSFEILKAEMGQLMYENETDVIYIMIEGTVYGIDLSTLKVKPRIEGLEEGSYAISQSNRFFAWIDPGKSYSASTLHLLDLQNNKQTDIREDSGYLRPLGFIRDDLIYGAADSKNISENMVGKTVFPMSWLKIMKLADTGYKVVKEYRHKGRYIGGITVSEGTIVVELLKKNSGNYEAAEGDSIMNRQEDERTKVVLKTIVTENKQREVVISQFRQISDSAKTRLITSKTVVAKGSKTVKVKTDFKNKYYYVYKKGDVLLADARLSKAISYAADNYGTVVDSAQKIIWMRTGKNARQAFRDIPSLYGAEGNSYQKALAALIKRAGGDVSVTEIAASRERTMEILQNKLKGKTVLDLTGCTTENLIWYVSCGAPVLAMTDKDSALLITGYGGGLINYFNPVNDETYSLSYAKADNIFAKAGAVFFSYIE